jgi:hypothetical protein
LVLIPAPDLDLEETLPWFIRTEFYVASDETEWHLWLDRAPDISSLVAELDLTPPEVTNVSRSADQVTRHACPDPSTVTISADVSDENLDSVVLRYQVPGGERVQVDMERNWGNRYSATIGPFPYAGYVSVPLPILIDQLAENVEFEGWVERPDRAAYGAGTVSWATSMLIPGESATLAFVVSHVGVCGGEISSTATIRLLGRDDPFLTASAALTVSEA